MDNILSPQRAEVVFRGLVALVDDHIAKYSQYGANSYTSGDLKIQHGNKRYKEVGIDTESPLPGLVSYDLISLTLSQEVRKKMVKENSLSIDGFIKPTLEYFAKRHSIKLNRRTSTTINVVGSETIFSPSLGVIGGFNKEKHYFNTGLSPFKVDVSYIIRSPSQLDISSNDVIVHISLSELCNTKRESLNVGDKLTIPTNEFIDELENIVPQISKNVVKKDDKEGNTILEAVNMYVLEYLIPTLKQKATNSQNKSPIKP